MSVLKKVRRGFALVPRLVANTFLAGANTLILASACMTR